MSNLELSLVFGAHGGVAVYEIENANAVAATPVFCGDLEAVTTYLRQRMAERIVEDEKPQPAIFTKGPAAKSFAKAIESPAIERPPLSSLAG